MTRFTRRSIHRAPGQVVVLAALLVCAAVATAAAEDRAGPPGSGVQIHVPDGWKTSSASKDGESFLISLSPDEEASVIYAVAEGANLQKAVKSLDGFLGRFVTDAKVAKVKKKKLNGMPAMVAKASATVKGKGRPVLIAIVIAQTPTGKAVFAIGIVNAAKKDAYGKTLDAVLAGLRPAK